MKPFERHFGCTCVSLVLGLVVSMKVGPLQIMYEEKKRYLIIGDMMYIFCMKLVVLILKIFDLHEITRHPEWKDTCQERNLH